MCLILLTCSLFLLVSVLHFIVCLSCLLNVEEAIHQFSEVGKLNGDLHQPSRIRYKSRSFSVSCLVPLAYRKGLISGVKLSVVVPQAIGISLRNTNHSALKYLVNKHVRILKIP